MKFFSLLQTHVGNFFQKIRFYIRRAIDRRKFYSAIVSMAKSGKLTAEDMERIQVRCAELDLALTDLKSVRGRAYTTALQAIRSVDLVTSERETDLNQIQKFLMIPDEEISKAKRDLARLRLLAEIESGNPPILLVQNIILQKDEVAHWSESAKLLEERVTGRRYEGGSSGMSFRIAKGVSYRVGNHRGRLITDKALLPISSGEIIVTSRRVLFKGGVKGFDVRLDKVLGFNFADDGMIFTVGSRDRPYVIQFMNEENVEVVKAILSLAMKKFAA